VRKHSRTRHIPQRTAAGVQGNPARKVSQLYRSWSPDWEGSGVHEGTGEQTAVRDQWTIVRPWPGMTFRYMLGHGNSGKETRWGKKADSQEPRPLCERDTSRTRKAAGAQEGGRPPAA
jgi:hypothetical protein